MELLNQKLFKKKRLEFIYLFSIIKIILKYSYLQDTCHVMSFGQYNWILNKSTIEQISCDPTQSIFGIAPQDELGIAEKAARAKKL